MTIRERIAKVRSKNEICIDVSCIHSDGHLTDNWFFLSDIEDGYPVDDFIPEEVLGKDLIKEDKYTKNKMKYLRLWWED